jgi:hypothetical protein
VKLVIPRPKSTGEEVPGVGKVCILYSSLLLSSVACLEHCVNAVVPAN